MAMRISVKKEQLLDLYKQFSARQAEYFLGVTPLDGPLEEMSLNLKNLKGGYKLNLHAPFSEALREQRDKDCMRLIDELIPYIVKALKSGKFHVKAVRNMVLILDHEKAHEYNYVVKLIYARAMDPVMITPVGSISGRALPALFVIEIACGDDNDVTLKERQLVNEKQFIDNTIEFFRIAELTFEAVYAHQKKAISEITFPLRPIRVDRDRLNAAKLGPFGMPFPGGKDLRHSMAIDEERPTVSFDEIGGLEEAKEEIHGLALAVGENKALYEKWATTPAKGVLLYGPPGTGKTLLAKALASAAKCPFFHVKIADILSVMHGQSELNMEEVFEIAKERAPSIIFFDELDAVAVDRDLAGSEVSRRIVSIILEKMSGIEHTDGVMIVASTNRLQAIDPALRRPGRFDRIIKVDLPDERAVEEIFTIHKNQAEKKAKRKLFDMPDMLGIATLSRAMKGMSGADIAEVLRRALERKVRLEGKTGLEQTAVSHDEVMKEIEVMNEIKKESNTGQYL